MRQEAMTKLLSKIRDYKTAFNSDRLKKRRAKAKDS